MTIIILILSLLPGFAWLFFYLQEDLHPEPKKLISLTFVMGMLSAIFALAIELFFNSTLRNFGIERLSLGVLLILGFVEELAKFGGAYYSVHKNPAFDEPVDAMIYMVVAALGFATVENIGAISGGGQSQTALLSNVFATTSLRFVGATLLHSLTSGLVGYYWALGIRELNVKKYLAYGFVVAAILHTAFNYLIIKYGNVIYTVVFLLIIGFFVLNDFEKLKRRAI